MKEARWEKPRFLGSELRGKPWCGRTRTDRSEVVHRARAFGMHAIAHDPLSPSRSRTASVCAASLDEVCAAADYLTLHVPATPETKHLLNEARLEKCKRGIRIINTARGELIDEAALYRAIEAGIVAGAGWTCSNTNRPLIGHLPNFHGDLNAAHRRLDRRSAGTGRPRDGHHGS
jgi:D-3-phosphoglycerate dehydrogenase